MEWSYTPTGAHTNYVRPLLVSYPRTATSFRVTFTALSPPSRCSARDSCPLVPAAVNCQTFDVLIVWGVHTHGRACRYRPATYCLVLGDGSNLLEHVLSRSLRSKRHSARPPSPSAAVFFSGTSLLWGFMTHRLPANEHPLLAVLGGCWDTQVSVRSQPLTQLVVPLHSFTVQQLHSSLSTVKIRAQSLGM